MFGAILLTNIRKFARVCARRRLPPVMFSHQLNLLLGLDAIQWDIRPGFGAKTSSSRVRLLVHLMLYSLPLQNVDILCGLSIDHS